MERELENEIEKCIWGGTEDGRRSSISIKGTVCFFQTVKTLQNAGRKFPAVYVML